MVDMRAASWRKCARSAATLGDRGKRSREACRAGTFADVLCRGPRRLASLFALGLLCGLATATPALAGAPMVLLLHGGGWHSGDPSEMSEWSAEFAARGYRTRSIAYPLGNVTGSIDYVDAIAQRERRNGAPVIAYGLSAGGTIAAALAAAGRVDGAVDVSGPTNFARWLSPLGQEIMLAIHMSAAEKVSASPLRRLNGDQSPQLVQCGLLDPVTSYDQCTSYVSAAKRGNRDTTLEPMINAHGQWSTDRGRAMRWVQARWPAG
jgi:acetyl esterase/lipase